jgi:hypothetical protein
MKNGKLCIDSTAETFNAKLQKAEYTTLLYQHLNRAFGSYRYRISKARRVGSFSPLLP